MIDPHKAIKAQLEIRADVVTANCLGKSDITTPFGGYKESGFGDREKSPVGTRPIHRDQDHLNRYRSLRMKLV